MAIRPNFWSSIRLLRLWYSSLSGSRQHNAHPWRKPIHHLHPKSSNSSRFKAWQSPSASACTHAVKSVIEDLISYTTKWRDHLAIASELRNLLSQKLSLQQSSPDHIRFKENGFQGGGKRRLDESSAYEPRKRRRW